MYNCMDYCDRYIERLVDNGYLILYPEEVAQLKELVTQGKVSELLGFIEELLGGM